MNDRQPLQWNRVDREFIIRGLGMQCQNERKIGNVFNEKASATKDKYMNVQCKQRKRSKDEMSAESFLFVCSTYCIAIQAQIELNTALVLQTGERFYVSACTRCRSFNQWWEKGRLQKQQIEELKS